MAALISPLSGQCLCQSSSFKIPAESVRFGFASCHCSVCRLAHAAPFVLWSGLNSEQTSNFVVNSSCGLSSFSSSEMCTRYFCSNCGTHLYIKYKDGPERWAGEVHFPTALLSSTSLAALEAHIAATGKPRYLHVFYSDKENSIGDLVSWANGPKHGGPTGLELLP